MAIQNLYSTTSGNAGTTKKKTTTTDKGYAGVLAGVASGALAPITQATNAATNNAAAGVATGAMVTPKGKVVGDLTLKEPISSGGGNYSGGSSAYDPTSDIMAAYNARQAALKNNYDAALNQRRQAYETAVGDLRNQGDEALREAYINMMMNRRGLNQSLEAAGLRGGATESAMANLYNRYASDRNAIARAIAQRLTEAGNEYGNDITELGLKYNQNGADAMSDYQNQIIKARQSLAGQLAKTGANANGTSQLNVSDEDLLGAYQGGTNNALAGALMGALPNLSNVVAAQNAAQTANNLPDYTTPGNTVARLRSMAPRDAYEYVMSMPTDDGTKLSILQAAFTRDELNEMANMF